MIINLTQNQALTTVQRVRQLPTWGKVLVRIGQEVDADEIIAEANFYPKHYRINIAQRLGTSSDESESHLKRKIGDHVDKDSIIAEREKTGRVVRSPSDGTIVLVENGIVLLQSNKRVYELKAGFPGHVAKVTAGQSATIESIGSYSQGVWGNDRLGSGSLTSLVSSREEPLTIENLKSQHSSVVSFAAWCDDVKVFEFAMENAWKGLILGSTPARFLPIISRLPFPVILTEGFGRIPLNSSTYELLNSHLGRNISLDAANKSHLSSTRPEFFIPAAKDIHPNPFNADMSLEIGRPVRILKGKYRGEVGTIADNKIGEMSRYPNGSRRKSVKVNLPDVEKVTIPLANIDVFM